MLLHPLAKLRIIFLAIGIWLLCTPSAVGIADRTEGIDLTILSNKRSQRNARDADKTQITAAAQRLESKDAHAQGPADAPI